MISMSKAYSIRQLRMEGDSIAEISRKLEVSRDTVYKYLTMEDLSQRPPALRDKAGADVAEPTVRNYVRSIKLERGASREQYLDLDWEPGNAQADFGGPTSTSPAVFRQADFSIPQIKNNSISPQVTKEIILTFVFATRIIATYPHFHDT